MQKSVQQPATPKVAQLHHYWRSLRRAAAGPAAPDPADPAAEDALPPPPRQLLNPAAIVPLLPNIMLVEFETAPFRIRYRLTGTLVDDASGINLTGRYLDDFNNGMNAPIFGPMIENYRRVWQSGQPVIDTYPWTTQNGRMATVCYGLFPLTIGGVISQVIAIEEYDPSRNLDPLVPRQPPRDS